MSTLDNLRREAKHWLKDVRGQEPSARARLKAAWPQAPANPGLRDIQHALAREHGFESWSAFKQAIAQRQAPRASTGPADRQDLVETFLGFACWDHHTHGVSAYQRNQNAAMRLLKRHPDVARDSLYTAVVCGDLPEVGRIILEQPELANRKGGPRGWEPLLYLCYGRLPLPALNDNALAMARALLDRGANPNAYYMAGAAVYSALVGVAGEGEQDAPRRHSYREPLYRLLLERGAGPYDIQVFYNTHFSGDMLWWLELTYAHDVKRGDITAWHDPTWAMLDMGGYGPGAYFVLRIAVGKNDLRLAEWALAHGADPNVMSSAHPKFKPKRTHYQEAMLSGQTEMADLLARHGAMKTEAVLEGEEAFTDACLRGNRARVQAILAEHPEYLRSPNAIFAAAEHDRSEVVEFLLDIGVPIEIEDTHRQRPLHVAAGNNALRVARLLIARGAAIDPRETQWNSTPLGFAIYADQRPMIDLLKPLTRSVWHLAWLGEVDRLREMLRQEPEGAREVSRNDGTPLMWLPDDEAKAAEIVDLLLEHGADPAIRTTHEGMSAADYARKRGLEDAARKLSAAAGTDASSPPAVRATTSATLKRFESLSKDLVIAYDTGEPSAIQHLVDQFGGHADWERVRAGVEHHLRTAPQSELPDGYFALPHARLVVARQAGFQNWAELVTLLESGRSSSSGAAVPPRRIPEIGPGMIEPVEIRAGLRVRMHDGRNSTTTQVWNMLTACRNGDLPRVTELVSAHAALVLCDYNYMTPLHLAVREGHLDVVTYLAERGSANPNYVTYPYRESLVTIARDRGYDEIARTLESWYARENRQRPEEEGGEIEYVRDEDRIRFQELVNAGAMAGVEEMLRKRPELALDEFAFWSEGILSMPANRGNRPILELLLRYGATVPQVTKWGAWYYFKRYEIAALLMQSGMSPHHMNCHHTTLLHDMAYTGDARKAALLLDHGAEIDAVDEEFRSTALGLAARFGKPEMVEFLLERGADPNRAGAPWATPLEWARKKAHAGIESLLRSADARGAARRSNRASHDTLLNTVNARINEAIQTKDVAALEQVLHEHRGIVATHRLAYLQMDAQTIIARAHTGRRLPVRPDIRAIEREVEAEGGGEAGRLAVAGSYGADTWERLELAVRLVDAIWRDDLAMVRHIVTKHPRLLHEDALIRSNSNWGPPMTYAANLGRNRIIKALHELGAVDTQWALGRSVLQGQIDTARMLCDMGARPSETELGGPAEALNAQGMAFLVELGIELTPQNAPVAMVLETYSRNPLGKHQILELFARHGVPLPDTPPMAVHRGRIDLLERHLRRDPELFSRTFAHGEMFPPELGCHENESLALVGTPLGGSGLLHMCVEYDEMEIASWMIEHGADVNLKARVDADGFGGQTPLFHSVVALSGGRRRHGELARLLLASGADPTVRASLRKGMRFSDDESVHEYHDVTPSEWGTRFHNRSLVNEVAMRMIAEYERV